MDFPVIAVLAATLTIATPLVFGANGEKLSKQNGAQALDTRDPLAVLNRAASTLGLQAQTGSVANALANWVNAWQDTMPCFEINSLPGTAPFATDPRTAMQ